MPRVTFHRLDYEGVLERLREVARRELGARPEVREVVLIGSLARGDWSARSDADLVVIVDRSDEPAVAFRAPDYLPRTSVGVPVDVFVYTPDEAAAWGPRYRADVESGLELYRRQAE